MRLFFAFFVSVNKKDKFSSFISTYGTVMKRGVLYYRTRIKDANGNEAGARQGCLALCFTSAVSLIKSRLSDKKRV